MRTSTLGHAPRSCGRLGRATLVAGAALAACLPATASAKNGSVAGSLATKLPRGAEATVVATNLANGSAVAVTSPRKNGSFKLSLPPGGYALQTIVVPPLGGGRVQASRVPVSLKSKQRRKALTVNTRKLPKKATRRARATRSYVQERGQVTPGVTAFGVEEFTGGTGDWAVLAPGLSYFVTTDLIGKTPCETAVVATGRDRAAIEAELELQKSKYFDPATRVKRNFVIADLMVSGSVTTAPDGTSSDVAISIRDARTGQVLDGLTHTLRENTVFEDAEQLAKLVAERVCRRPAAYKLTLTVNGRGDFATHSATGAMRSEVTALRSGGEAGKLPSAWSGTTSFDWMSVAATSRTDCSYGSGGGGGTWSAQLSVAGEDQVRVDWSYGDRSMATLVATCPIDDAPPAVIPGQPGPALLGVEPLSATLPLGGGVIALHGGFTAGGDGWTNDGQLVVEPVWQLS